MKKEIKKIIKEINFDLQDNTAEDIYNLFNELYINDLVKFYPQFITTPSGYESYIQIACHEWNNIDMMIVLDSDPKTEYKNIDEIIKEINRLNIIRDKYNK